MVTASVQGRVIDQNGVPVGGAAVTSGTASATSDINGIFTFSKISLSSRFGYVQATKSGYFTGSRSIITSAGDSSFVTIRLISRSETGSFAAATGGRIMVFSGDSVAFGPASVVTASTNAAYTGTVHVFATYLNPTNNNAFQYMPGDLRGIGSDGKETAIQSFGMMEIELRDDAGNKLQIASGQTATLTMAIPATLQSSAPATIPLWYFNDSTGRWIQQGSATRQGADYVGQVSHFSWWNCDAPVATVNFKIKVRDQYGNPVPRTYIGLNAVSLGAIRGGYTDLNGNATGMIPKGVPLVMTLLTECGNILGGINVGPALQDLDFGTLSMTVSNTELTLSGKVVDCSNNPVDSGLVDIAVDGLYFRAAVKSGSFTMPITRCYSTTVPVMLTARDLTAQQTGTQTSVNASFGQVDAGQLSACGVTYSQIISLNVNGNSYQWTDIGDIFSYSPNAMSAHTTDFSRQIGLYSTTAFTATGQYQVRPTLYYPNTHYVGNTPIQMTITSFGAVNGYISGTLSGSIMDSLAIKTVPLTGTFKVLRTQ